MAWVLSAEEVTYYKSIGQVTDADDTYVSNLLPLLLDYVNANCTTTFTQDDLPGSVKLFLSGALGFFYNAQFGVKSEKMGTVSFGYDFSSLPDSLTALLAPYGFGEEVRQRKQLGTARFRTL